jgi:hypothetical protein
MSDVLGLQGLPQGTSRPFGRSGLSGGAESCISLLSVGAAAMPGGTPLQAPSSLGGVERELPGGAEHCISLLSVGAAAMPGGTSLRAPS